MAKLSTSVVRRPGRVTIDRTFTDPANPELTFSLKLRRLSALEWVAAADQARDLAEQYVYGINGAEPEPLPPVDGQPVYTSESTFKMLCALEYAQVADTDDRYTAIELLIFATVDAIQSQLMKAFQDLQNLTGQTADGENSPLASIAG